MDWDGDLGKFGPPFWNPKYAIPLEVNFINYLILCNYVWLISDHPWKTVKKVSKIVIFINPRTPKVKIHLRTPKGGVGTTPPPGFWSSRRNFSKISRMGMFSGSRNPTVITKKFYLHCMTLKIKVKHPFEWPLLSLAVNVVQTWSWCRF